MIFEIQLCTWGLVNINTSILNVFVNNTKKHTECELMRGGGRRSKIIYAGKV